MSIKHRVELKVRRDDKDGIDLVVIHVETDDRQAAIDQATALVRAEGFEVMAAVARVEDAGVGDLWFEWVAPRSFLLAALHILSRGAKDSSETALCGMKRAWKARRPLFYAIGADGQVAIRKPIPVAVVCNRCMDAALDLALRFGASVL